jgi:single-stranded-DNA-specific exonuclease
MSFTYSTNPQWKEVKSMETRVVELLEKKLTLPTMLCQLLAVRGYQDPEAAKKFLRPMMHNLQDPTALSGVAEAARRLKEAIYEKDTILVHGDYDVDGIVATALLTRWIRKLGGHCVPFIPNRLTDGYDFGPAGLSQALESKAKVIITVDSGIRAHETIAEAKALGIDVIITDHHTPGNDLPEAVSVVNPNQPGCNYVNKGLCGTGVAYRLCQILATDLGIPDEELHSYLDFVALATIADVVPLTEENRTLVRYGLRVLQDSKNCGLKTLINVINKPIDSLDSGYVAFQLAPRINAAGRMGTANTALELLMTDDRECAEKLSRKLESENVKRRDEESKILDEALDLLAEDFDPQVNFGVTICAKGWHPGVIGIIASRIAERVHRPTVVLSILDNEARGSARSVSGFDLLSSLNACQDHLERFGGHRAAAGLTLSPSKVDAFKRDFNAEVSRSLRKESLRPILKPDIEIQLSEVNRRTFHLLSYFGPYGASNPTPLFLAREVKLIGSARKVGKDHLKLRVRQLDKEFDAIGFNLASRISPESLEAGPLDIVFRIKENSYRAKSQIELQLLDVRLSGENHPRDS